jgi:hypothetical protein
MPKTEKTFLFFGRLFSSKRGCKAKMAFFDPFLPKTTKKGLFQALLNPSKSA